MVRFGASYCSQVICSELSWQPLLSATMRSQKTSSREFSSHFTCSHICELALTAVSWRVAKECSTETWKKIVQRKVWLLWRENCCLKVCFHEEVVSKRLNQTEWRCESGMLAVGQKVWFKSKALDDPVVVKENRWCMGGCIVNIKIMSCYPALRKLASAEAGPSITDKILHICCPFVLFIYCAFSYQ